VLRALQTFAVWVTARHRRTVLDLVLIVRRGMRAEYYSFCRILATTNRVPVLVDRRVGDRRQRLENYWGIERRRGADRRTAAPRSWTDSQFVMTRMATKGAPLLAPEDLPEMGTNAVEFSP
jgi:hypothetical protein